MGLSALRSVSDAIDATREFTFPLSIRRWASMAVVVLFVGMPGTPVPASPQFLDPRLWETPEPPQGSGNEGESDADGGSADLQLEGDVPIEVFDPGTWPAWLLAAVGVLLAVVVLYAVVGALMHFVLVESLRHDAVRVRRYGRANLGNGLRLLGFRLVLGLVGGGAVAALGSAVTPVGPWSVDGWTTVAVATATGALATLVIAVDSATRQFVVPTMLAEGTGVLGGWRRFWPTLRGDLLEYGVYAVVRTVVGGAVGVAALIATLVALLLGGVVVGTLGALVLLVTGGVSGVGTVGVAVIGVLLAGFVVYGIFAYAVIAVPFQVYLWSYALLVLGDTDPDLDLIPEYRAAARSGDGFGTG